MPEEIKVKLRADSGQLSAEFGKAQRSVKSFSKDTGDSLKKLVAFGSGLVGLKAGIGIFDDLRQQYDRLGKLANRFDLPVESVQKLSLAAELTGSDIEKLVAGLTKATVAGQEAEQGLETYVRQFDALGIELESFNAATPDQKLSILADSFRDAEDGTKAFTAAYRILGKAGGDLIPLLRGGSEGIKQISEDLHTLDDGQIKAIEKFNDQLALLKSNFQAGIASSLSEEDLDKLVDLLQALAKGIGSVTKIFVANGKALADVAKIYVGYRVALKALDFSSLLKGLAASSLRFRSSTSAVSAETAALTANTAAKAKNASASARAGRGGAGGKVLGAAGLALAIPELFQLGKGLGDKLADSLFKTEDLAASAEIAELSKQLLKDQEKMNALKREQSASDSLAAENLEFRRKAISDAAAAEKAALARRAAAAAELRSEVLALAGQVMEVEVGFLAPEEQLARVEKTMAGLQEAAAQLAGKAGGEGGVVGPKEAFNLAKTAFNGGDVEKAKELLTLAKSLRETSEKRAALENEISAAKQEQAAVVQDQLRQEQEQGKARASLAIELKALQLGAAGKKEAAQALKEEFDLRGQAARLAEETGLSEEKTLGILREKKRLEEQINSEKKEGLETERKIVARGIFKLGGTRQQLAGVPDIGAGGIRESVKSERVTERTFREKVNNRGADLGKHFDRLIENSDSLLQVWNNIQAI